MNGTPDAPSAGSDPPAAPVHTEFAIEEVGKKDGRWRLVLRPGDLALLEGADPQPFVILREQMQKDVVLIEGLGVLSLKKPKKVAFKLSPEAVSAVADWLGTGALASFYLKQRYSWVLAIAIIWIFGSLPVPGNADAGVEAVPLDAFGMGLGVVLAISWAFAKWRPQPILFLVDSVWFLCLTGYLVLGVWDGRSKLWMILVAALLWMAIKGFKLFARFRGVKIDPQAASLNRR